MNHSAIETRFIAPQKLHRLLKTFLRPERLNSKCDLSNLNINTQVCVYIYIYTAMHTWRILKIISFWQKLLFTRNGAIMGVERGCGACVLMPLMGGREG